jgi:hypothetical protein
MVSIYLCHIFGIIVSDHFTGPPGDKATPGFTFWLAHITLNNEGYRTIFSHTRYPYIILLPHSWPLPLRWFPLQIVSLNHTFNHLVLPS